MRGQIFSFTCPFTMRTELEQLSRAVTFASKQGVQTPVASASRGHIQEEKTEKDGRDPLVLKGRYTIRRVKLPIRYRQHAGQNEGDWPRCQANCNRDTAKELEQP